MKTFPRSKHIDKTKFDAWLDIEADRIRKSINSQFGVILNKREVEAIAVALHTVLIGAPYSEADGIFAVDMSGLEDDQE